MNGNPGKPKTDPGVFIWGLSARKRTRTAEPHSRLSRIARGSVPDNAGATGACASLAGIFKFERNVKMMATELPEAEH